MNLDNCTLNKTTETEKIKWIKLHWIPRVFSVQERTVFKHVLAANKQTNKLSQLQNTQLNLLTVNFAQNQFEPQLGLILQSLWSRLCLHNVKWKVTAYVKLELKAYLISRNGSKEVYLLTFIVESNFAILHYCTISTCPWFSESTEIKHCIPPCAANDSICVKSFKSYICKCPYGFNPSFGHKGVLLHCQGMTKLHVLVFWCHLKKKIETLWRLLSFKVKEKYPSGCC